MKAQDFIKQLQHLNVQCVFQRNVQSLIPVFEELGNPIFEKSQYLMILDTRNIVESSGENQYTMFIEERLVKKITKPITKNRLALFSNPSVKHHPTKQLIQVIQLKNDCNLLSRLYIHVSCQTRDRNLDRFFTHENQANPTSLSIGGKIRSSAKSDLLHCFQMKEK